MGFCYYFHVRITDRVHNICSCIQQDPKNVAVDETTPQTDGLPLHKLVERPMLILDDSISGTEEFREETINIEKSEPLPEILVKPGAVSYNPMEKVDDEKYSKFIQLLQGEDV